MSLCSTNRRPAPHKPEEYFPEKKDGKCTVRFSFCSDFIHIYVGISGVRAARNNKEFGVLGNNAVRFGGNQTFRGGHKDKKNEVIPGL
jgi:hypothetical protein